MTIYEFECTNCRNRVELELPVEKAGGEGVKCPKCGKKTLKRIYSFYSKTGSSSGTTGVKASSCPTGTCPFVN